MLSQYLCVNIMVTVSALAPCHCCSARY